MAIFNLQAPEKSERSNSENLGATRSDIQKDSGGPDTPHPRHIDYCAVLAQRYQALLCLHSSPLPPSQPSTRGPRIKASLVR